MAKNEYKGADRWTTIGRGVRLLPQTEEQKKQIEELNRELAARDAAARKKNAGGSKKKSK